MVDFRAIIIQIGSDRCRAGFSGEDFPKVDFHTVVGIRKDVKHLPKQSYFEKQSFVGDCFFERDNYHLKFPVDEIGFIWDFDMMEKIWNHCFYDQLKINPSNLPCMMTEAYFNFKSKKEKTTQEMFETFNIPAFQLQNSAVLSLIASGRSTGVVVDCGEGISHIVPIFELSSLYPAILKTDFTGKNITDYCMNTMLEAGYRSTTDRTIFKNIKERFCYVALDYDSEVQSSQNTLYELPDGSKLTLKDERFRIPEVLFQPQLTGKDNLGLGLSELTYQSIMKCDVDLRRDLLSNIVLSGGTTMFSGFPERLSKDITSLAPSNYNIQVIAPSERQHSAFLGGSILSSLSSFQPYWITNAEYEEEGPRVIHRKQILCLQRE